MKNICFEIDIWKILFFVILGLSALTLFMRPLSPEPWQWADDALYFKNANAICDFIKNPSGQWLGQFDAIVLSKAPLFPIFLAITHMLGLPVCISEWLLYLPLPFLLVIALGSNVFNKNILLFWGGVCFYFIPIVAIETRLLRNVFYGALVFYVFLAFSGFIVRIVKQKPGAMLWLLICGFTFGLVSITREETSWIFIPLSVGFFFVIIKVRRTLFTVGTSICIFFVAYITPAQTVSVLNLISYDIYSPSLRQNASFRELFNLLCSLEPNKRVQFVPIITETRERVYTISPTFAKLQPYIEGNYLDDFAKNEAHHKLNNYDLSKREFFVSNFEFALAKSIILAGNTTGKSFESFCLIASEEIKNGIIQKEIESGRKGIGLLPPINENDVYKILIGMLRSAYLLVSMEGIKINYPPVKILESDAITWLSFNHSWPWGNKNNIHERIKKTIFKLLVKGFKALFPICILITIPIFILYYRQKNSETYDLLVIQITAIAGVVSCIMAIAIVDTVGFPVLQWPVGYNSLCFYPLHFLLCVSVFIFFNFLNSSKNDHKKTIAPQAE
jgi:hypothetical protein